MDGEELGPPSLSLDATNVTDGATPSISKNPTPFDGEHVAESTTITVPIFSASGLVYVAAPVTRSAVQQKRVATLNSSTWATVEDAQIRAVSHDSNIGHRGAAACVSGSRILAGAGYNQTWGEKTSTSNLAALAAVSDPISGNQASYWQYSVDPYTGDIYLAVRAGTAIPRSTIIYKWNGTGWTEWADLLETGGYTTPLAFASDGTIFAVGQFTVTGADSGYPRSDASIVKTSDDGATWTRLDGSSVTLPLTKVNAGTPIFRPGFFNITRLAVDGSDNPVAFAAWKTQNQDFAVLAQAAWDGTQVVHRQILDHPPGASIGDVTVAYHDGLIVLAVGEYDIVNDPVAGPTAPYPVGKLWLLVTDDGGDNWVRYELHDADGTNGYGGAYLDPTSLAVDGVVRLLPMDLVTVSNHEVWELALP